MLGKHTLRTALALTVLALTGLASAAGPGRTIDAKLTPRGFWTVFGAGGRLFVSIPRFHLYDKEGRRILDLSGFDQSFGETLQKAVEAHSTITAGGGTLSQEIALVRKTDGTALNPAELAADFTAVEYWADWCLPCKRQREELDAFRQAHPDVHLDLVAVEADARKVDPQAMADARKWAPRSPSKP